MMKFSPTRLKELFERFNKCQIAVIGDLMLDNYLWGSVQRISPEAPVPVVEVTSETVKLGGAANVAYNILNLGAKVLPFGVVGNDSSANEIRSIFNSIGVNTEAIVSDTSRPTTVKTRIIAHDQHVVRADIESKANLPNLIEQQILDLFRKKIGEINGVILEDYNKGVLTPTLINEIVSICNQNGIFIAVDPKFINFFEYKNVDLLKPNRRETEQALGIKINSDKTLYDAAQTIFSKLNCRHLMITLGSEGMSLFNGIAEQPLKIPTYAEKIYDVSGAGDTVIATMVVAKLAGATLQEAMTMANYAASIVCKEVGVVPIEATKLKQLLLED